MVQQKVDHLILLRGLLRGKEHWGDFPKELAEKLQVQVSCIDLPGVGENLKEIPPFHVFGMAEFIHEQAKRHIDFSKERVGLFGLSLGGMVALEMMAHFKKDYVKAMVVNTSSNLSPKVKRLRKQVWMDVVKLALETNKIKREKKVVEKVVNSPEGREKAFGVWSKIIKDFKFHPLTPVAQLKAASGFRPSLELKGLEEIRLLSSMGDLFVDPSCSELLHQRYGWQLHSHPWGGHDLAWDDSQWLLSEALEFFA